MPCTWTFSPAAREPEPPDLGSWAAELNVSPFLARLLWHRGVHSLPEMDVFLSPGLRHLPSLDDWPELQRAAGELARQLERGPTVAVWGDYDVDGVTATALLTDFLRSKGAHVLPYLPDRHGEGYGLNAEGLHHLAEQGVDLLITVDCGISDLEAVELANQLGMTVIVTDHHLPGAQQPRAAAVVDPKLQGGAYADAAGVGVAFLLAAALNRLLPGNAVDIRQYLDLVAIGTIADVVDLTGANRILVKNGLLLLKEAKRPGVFALKEVSGLPPTAVMGSGQVGFSLGPRLNAAGRMESADMALKLLMAPDLSTARPLAAELDRLNTSRRSVEDTVLREALAQAEEQADSPGLVLFGQEWHQGIIGIVASRIVDRYYRPTLLLTSNGDKLKGSGRSIPEFDLYRALENCSEHLLGYGGHKQAAGLSLSPDGIEALRARFNQAVTAQLGQERCSPSLSLEASLGLNMVDLDLVKEIDMLQPFGPGNPQPLFCSQPLQVQGYKRFGKSHVSLQVRDQEAEVTMLGKAWGQAEALGPEVRGKRLQLAFTPRLNHYNGLTSIDLTIKDWRELS